MKLEPISCLFVHLIFHLSYLSLAFSLFLSISRLFFRVKFTLLAINRWGNQLKANKPFYYYINKITVDDIQRCCCCCYCIRRIIP